MLHLLDENPKPFSTTKFEWGHPAYADSARAAMSWNEGPPPHEGWWFASSTGDRSLVRHWNPRFGWSIWCQFDPRWQPSSATLERKNTASAPREASQVQWLELQPPWE